MQHMSQPSQTAGSDEQRAIIDRHFGTVQKVPIYQRVRDAINLFDQGRRDALKQAWLDRFHAVRVLGREATKQGIGTAEGRTVPRGWRCSWPRTSAR